MKVITRHICGEDRVLCYSIRVSKEVTARFGKGGVREAVKGGDAAETLDAVVWMLQLLMDAGKRYADKNGIPCPPAPGIDDLLDDYGLDDLEGIYSAINDAMTAGKQQEVEAETKNAAATQGAPALRG